MLSLRQRADEDQEKMSRHNTLDFSNVDIVAPICLCGFVPSLLAVLSLSTVRVIINDNDTQRQIQSVETPNTHCYILEKQGVLSQHVIIQCPGHYRLF